MRWPIRLPPSFSLSRSMNSATLAPVASITLEVDSVDGQRCLPSREIRLLRLKVVGSRPALRARPDAVRPYFSARPSSAAQIALWVSMGTLSCNRSEEHTSELQSLMRISYAVFCLNKKTQTNDPLSL